MAKANVAFAVGLMTLLMLVTIVYLPIVLPLPLPGVEVDALQIALSLVVTLLVPLLIGLFIKSRYEGAAQTLQSVTMTGTAGWETKEPSGSVSPESQCVGERLTVVVVADEDERRHRHDGRVAWVTCRVCQAAFNLVTTPFEGRQLALARWPSQLLQPGRPAMWASRRRWW